MVVLQTSVKIIKKVKIMDNYRWAFLSHSVGHSPSLHYIVNGLGDIMDGQAWVFHDMSGYSDNPRDRIFSYWRALLRAREGLNIGGDYASVIHS